MQVVDITIPDLGLSRVAHATLIGSEFAQAAQAELRAGLRSRWHPLHSKICAASKQGIA